MAIVSVYIMINDLTLISLEVKESIDFPEKHILDVCAALLVFSAYIFYHSFRRINRKLLITSAVTNLIAILTIIYAQETFVKKLGYIHNIEEQFETFDPLEETPLKIEITLSLVFKIIL